jgi:hypothetical protein
MLLELGDERGFVGGCDGRRGTRMLVWHERATLTVLRQVAKDRTPMDMKPRGRLLNGQAVGDGRHDPLPQIEMIGAHGGLRSVASIAPSQLLRNPL